MRRLKILFFWIFVNKNNVGFKEMLQFLIKPKIHPLAKRYIKDITKKEDFEVALHGVADILYWPSQFPLNRLDQVICETFDSSDWHYYQKEHTEIRDGEILLDIGTAEGLFPLTVADKCSHIYMIEPGATFINCLKKSFSRHLEKVTLFNYAIGNMDGEISFNEDSLDGKVAEGDNNNAPKIGIRKIDTLLAGKKITYLKADIEGYEQEMLKGAGEVIKANKPRIAITTYHTENDPYEIISIIKGFVPEYKHYVIGIYEQTPKPVMIHFWI